ncbi:MAG TPA: sulfotransferase [Myxococcales bacterium]|nr:sulfotransferase [Myxococcales bacterium]
MIALLQELDSRGIRLKLKGEEVEFVGPKGAMTPELLRQLRAHKADLRDYLLLDPGATAAAGGSLSFDPDQLIAEVMAEEEQRSLGPEGEALREALGAYARSVEQDARPSGLGRIYLRERILRLSLRTRLRFAPHYRPGARPDRAPLIVCGLPRSGTTLLHRLLALADDGAGLPLWQLLEPLPPGRGPDLRYDHATRNLKWLAGLVPVSLDAQHYVRPDLADECGHLLRTAFLGAMPWQAPAHGWLEWSMKADAGPAYRVWAALLARLQPAGKRLVLKDPLHTAYLDEVRAACPDALVVQTHRDPLEVAPSFHKLCATMHAVLAPDFDRARAVEAQTRWLEWMVERNAAARARFPEGQLVDVGYRALAADPVGQVERIHRAFGLPLTEGHLQRMRAYVAKNGQRRHGENPYSAEEFGQRPEELARRFEGYRRRFSP